MRKRFNQFFESNLLFQGLDRRISLNTFSLLIIYGLNFGISLLTLPHLIKNFGIEKWGIIVFYQIILNYLIWLIDWSFNQYSAKFISIFSDNLSEQKKIFTETKSAQLILTLISLLLSILILSFLNNLNLFLSFSLILIGNYLNSFWFLNGIEKIYESALLQLFNKCFFAYFILTLINQNSEINKYFLFYGFSNLITGLICQFLISYKYSIKIKIVSLKKGLNTLKKSSKLFLSSIVGSIINSSIPLLINFSLGNKQLGIYNIADRIKGISVQLAHPLSHSIYPRMAKEYNKDKALGNKLLKKVLGLLLIVTFIGFILINIFIKEIIGYFSNENILTISIVLRILLISFIINVIEEIMVNHYLVPNGLYNSINKIKISILLTSLISCLPLIYLFGIKGAAIANLMSELVGLSYIIYVYKATKRIEHKHQSFS